MCLDVPSFKNQTDLIYFLQSSWAVQDTSLQPPTTHSVESGERSQLRSHLEHCKWVVLWGAFQHSPAQIPWLWHVLLRQVLLCQEPWTQPWDISQTFKSKLHRWHEHFLSAAGSVLTWRCQSTPSIWMNSCHRWGGWTCEKQNSDGRCGQGGTKLGKISKFTLPQVPLQTQCQEWANLIYAGSEM